MPANRHVMTDNPLTRVCRNLSEIRNGYPEGTREVSFNLKEDEKNGLLRYDREFLLQFMPLCLWRPVSLPPLDILGLELRSNRRDHYDALASYSQDIIDNNVGGLLDTLTPTTFEAVAGEVIRWSNMSETEIDGRTIQHILGLVFEKAITDATQPKIWANLCERVKDNISPKIHDDRYRTKKGTYLAGAQLFRTYLNNRSLDEFDRHWVKGTSSATPLLAALADKSTTSASPGLTNEHGQHADSHYSHHERLRDPSSRKQGHAFMQFLGALFEGRVLLRGSIRKYMKKVLDPVNHNKENFESVCVFLTAMGGMHYTKKEAVQMDKCISHMRSWAKDPEVEPRIQEMLAETIALQERRRVEYISALAGDGRFEQLVGNLDKDAAESLPQSSGDAGYIQDGAEPVTDVEVGSVKACLGGLAEKQPDIQRVSQAQDSEKREVAKFLERLVQTKMCSTALLPAKEKTDVIESIVSEIAAKAPEALRRLALIVQESDSGSTSREKSTETRDA